MVAAAFVPLYAEHLGSTVVSRAPSAMDKIVLTSCAGWLAENGDKGLRFNKPLGHSANRKTSPALLQVDDHVFPAAGHHAAIRRLDHGAQRKIQN